MISRPILIALLLLGCSSCRYMSKNSALAFHFHRPDVTVTAPKSSVSTSLLLPSSRSTRRHGSSYIIHNKNIIGINNVNNLHSREFSTRMMSMEDEDDDVDYDADSSNNNFFDNTATNTNSASNTELAYLLPGQSLRIRIGDTNASRKAWKKRRRNASPILIPASILNVSRQALLRWNVFALLCSIGEEVINPKNNGENLLGATVGKLGRAYKRTLQGDLREHAIAMGYDSVELLLASLFDEMDLVEERENGNGGSIVRSFVEPRHGNLVLGTPLSRRQGRAMAASAGLVQFQLIDGDAQKNTKQSTTMMVHTGMAVPRPPAGKSISTTTSSSLAPEPLGAALRVYDGAIARRYQEGDEIDAVVHSYDDRGDGGGPLLVLAMARDPQGRGQGGGGGGVMLSSPAYVVGRSSSSSRSANSGIDDAGVERELTDLKAGDGPFDATVVAVSSRSGAAFVDCGVGRRRGKKYGGGLTRVLGMLRFEDGAIIDETDDDGVAIFRSDDFDIEAGDEIQVYIRAVSPQSGRFMVTLDPSIKDKKAKDLKLEKRADKRKERLLSKRISQEDIQNLIGNVYDGVVKAKSKTGDWYYVQPCVGEDMSSCDESWPVGVANALSKVGEPSGSSETYSVGDHVRVRLEGIDERRGQLALTLLED